MKKSINPKVSIVIPLYNGSKYVKEAIDSALAQTYKNIEIVVVNDGSTDEGKSEAIVKSYGNKIKYYKKENGGVSTSLNLAIKKSSGEYISWLSHDDVYYSDKIQKQIDYIIANNYYDKNVILYGDYDLIDNKSRLITKCTKDHVMLTEKPEYALLRGSINGITLLIPKRAFNEFGLFDESLRCAQDYEMWQRMSKGYKFVHMSGIIAKSRQHHEQVTVKSPKVITEGNELWTDLVESTPKKAMERLEGSEYAFYMEMAKFLKDSPYAETAKFCEDKCASIAEKVLAKVKDIKVSVIIPFYNRIDLVINSLKSVINQTHKNIEIIIVNDGSEESTTKLNKIIESDNRIKNIKLNKNKGTSNAKNVGMDNATGDYIAFLDSDDLFKENKIEAFVQVVFLFYFL
jgi:glycosyltransferase involved in cell wall biosynthesis